MDADTRLSRRSYAPARTTNSLGSAGADARGHPAGPDAMVTHASTTAVRGNGGIARHIIYDPLTSVGGRRTLAPSDNVPAAHDATRVSGGSTASTARHQSPLAASPSSRHGLSLRDHTRRQGCALHSGRSVRTEPDRRHRGAAHRLSRDERPRPHQPTRGVRKRSLRTWALQSADSLPAAGNPDQWRVRHYEHAAQPVLGICSTRGPAAIDRRDSVHARFGRHVPRSSSIISSRA